MGGEIVPVLHVSSSVGSRGRRCEEQQLFMKQGCVSESGTHQLWWSQAEAAHPMWCPVLREVIVSRWSWEAINSRMHQPLSQCQNESRAPLNSSAFPGGAGQSRIAHFQPQQSVAIIYYHCAITPGWVLSLASGRVWGGLLCVWGFFFWCTAGLCPCQIRVPWYRLPWETHYSLCVFVNRIKRASSSSRQFLSLLLFWKDGLFLKRKKSACKRQPS